MPFRNGQECPRCQERIGQAFHFFPEAFEFRTSDFAREDAFSFRPIPGMHSWPRCRHLTAGNHERVIERASNTTVAEVKKLVAGLAPQPDVPASVRKLPVPVAAMRETETAPALKMDPAPALDVPVAQPLAPPRVLPPAPRSVVAPLAPARYRVQFTIDAETKDQLDRLQALLRREIPDGDPGAIFKRAIGLLLDKLERTKLGKADRPRPSKITRFETDAPEGTLPPRAPANAVKRAVWPRDGGRCAYVSPGGRRCSERVFLEFHHQRPYALRGQGTEDNIALRCRRHNQYEAELVFGGARLSVSKRTPQLPAR